MADTFSGKNAEREWTAMSATKQNLMTRAERYAALTIRKVALRDGVTPETMDMTHDWQSLGAQAVNHVVNKLMTAMFAPSRPFFRVAEGKKTKQAAAQANIPADQLNDVLASMEREGTKMLDSKGQRPKLYQACRHLVVTGNCLMILDEGVIRVMGLKYFCVKRTHDQQVHTLIVRERLPFGELSSAVRGHFNPDRFKADQVVSHYRYILKTDSGYEMSQWVDNERLPTKQFGAKWNNEAFPYRVLSWDLTDESDYGTGLVEEYAGDFEALSQLAEAVVTGAVLGTEFRWVMHPHGVTNADDFKNSSTGDTIPGAAKDVNAITPGTAEGVKMAREVAQEYIQRISRGFLMGSAVTRNAERVTAEEIRLTSMELESSFGGTYSALAPSMQQPVATWMLREAGTSVTGTDLSVVIVTGLDALSRNGDLENLKMALATLASFSQGPPELMQRIKWTELAAFVGQGAGIDLKPFFLSQEEVAKMQEQARQAQVQQDTQTAQGEANAQAAAQEGMQ